MGKRQTKEWWKDHYNNYLLSKLSIGEYSKENGISKSTFYGWIKKFRESGLEDDISDTKVQWATLSPAASPERLNIDPKEYSSMKITIGKAIIEITSDIDFKFLSSVIKVLVNNA